MWTKIKKLYTIDKLITWCIMPLVIIVGLFVGIQLYSLAYLEISNTDHKLGTIESIEKDFKGYEGRLRYRIKLKEFEEEFYIKNVMTEKVVNLHLVSSGKVSDIYFIPDKDENDIVSMEIGSISILSISKFNEHYKNVLMINVIGTTVFLIWFGFRVLRRRARHEATASNMGKAIRHD